MEPLSGLGETEGESRLHTFATATRSVGSPDYGKYRRVPLTLCPQADRFKVVPYFCV